jgi:hypothetical protein
MKGLWDVDPNDACLATLSAPKQIIVAANPLPPTGVHYWEVSFTRPNWTSVRNLGGCYDIGVTVPKDLNYGQYVTSTESSRCKFWSLHDGDGKFTSPGAYQVAWSGATPYTSGDWIGVKMDLDKRMITFYKNKLLLGTPEVRLPPEETFYPFACGFNIYATVKIRFPDLPDEQTS